MGRSQERSHSRRRSRDSRRHRSPERSRGRSRSSSGSDRRSRARRRSYSRSSSRSRSTSRGRGSHHRSSHRAERSPGRSARERQRSRSRERHRDSRSPSFRASRRSASPRRDHRRSSRDRRDHRDDRRQDYREDRRSRTVESPPRREAKRSRSNHANRRSDVHDRDRDRRPLSPRKVSIHDVAAVKTEHNPPKLPRRDQSPQEKTPAQNAQMPVKLPAQNVEPANLRTVTPPQAPREHTVAREDIRHRPQTKHSTPATPARSPQQTPIGTTPSALAKSAPIDVDPVAQERRNKRHEAHRAYLKSVSDSNRATMKYVAQAADLQIAEYWLEMMTSNLEHVGRRIERQDWNFKKIEDGIEVEELLRPPRFVLEQKAETDSA